MVIILSLIIIIITIITNYYYHYFFFVDTGAACVHVTDNDFKFFISSRSRPFLYYRVILYKNRGDLENRIQTFSCARHIII